MWHKFCQGQIINGFTLLTPAELFSNSAQYGQWLCRCNHCGTTNIEYPHCIGECISCGKIKPGTRFGSSVIVALNDSWTRGHSYLLQCDCGNTYVAKGNHLKSGRRISCGRCIPDLVGQRFWYLTVMDYAGKDKHSKHLWLCKCDCGNTKKVITNSLKSGATKSCGCLKSDVARQTMNLYHLRCNSFNVKPGTKITCDVVINNLNPKQLKGV